MAEALLIRISRPPKTRTASSIAASTCSSSRTSTTRGSARPPAASISAAAVWMVPASFLCGLSVFAAITTLAPSAAARLPMARPIPRLAPVINSVFPARSAIASLLLHMSVALEDRPALFLEGGDALGPVIRRGANRKILRFERQMLFQRMLQRPVQQLLGAADGDRRAVCQPLRELRCLRFEIIRRDDKIDEAEILRGFGIEPIAQHGDLHRLLHADDARQHEGAAAIGRGTDTNIGERDKGILGRDHHIAGKQERETEPSRTAPHARHDRLRHP